VAGDGRLSPIAGSPFADGQTAPCWTELTHDGRFLFTVNTGSGTISRYSIARDGGLTLLGSTPVDRRGGVGAVDARLSRDGRTLYVNESRIAVIGEFHVRGGRLARRGAVALPPGATPAGVAVK
jgi:sugar lactone lactonase YvrE